MINLQKGQRIEIGLSKVGVGLGWDPNESTGFDFDLDASAFMLNSNKNFLKMSSLFSITTNSLLTVQLNHLVMTRQGVIVMVVTMRH